MCLNLPTLVTCGIVLAGGLIAIPALAKGFRKRGSGIHKPDFVIQRLPQYMSLANVALLVFAFTFFTGILPLDLSGLGRLIALTTGEPQGLFAFISWLGVFVLASGMLFMVGGWYNLGEYFSTDSEILDNQGVRKTGLYGQVMHPIYSGIIQCLVGASLACTSIFCLAFALLVVASLWIRRAKYEEEILLKHLGASYKAYGDEMHWRRLIPKIIPFGF